ncbi:hypothetical protein RhiirC2_856406 [Rhizophagus irregularis]|uniref:Galactose oxidase n=1 Tax=Rhizophagus irregularis TaxID=588596 RepID=A0A2N1MHU0_9GLOM|nr:hypothetical protein RhiirC2_856406 [Rhizophagus irregularis]
MLQKYFVYITLWFLFQFILIEINCQKAPYTLKKRSKHTATLVDNKFWKRFFYIDFSVSFNIQNLLLTDLSNINTVPSHFGAASARGGANNDTLFICGGIGNVTVDKVELVYSFNLQSNSWSIPKITGESPIILFAAETGIINYNGMMYFWDGIVSDKKGSSIGASKGGLGSAATLLPDNKIICMGGAGDKSTLMNLVYIYDTINDFWSTKVTSGTVPHNKLGSTAVIGLDGQRVIVFGASRENHRANVIGNYMVITFGIYYSAPENILLLDISNVDEYIWTNEFNPSSSIVKSSLPTVPTIPTKPSPLQTISSQQYISSDNSNIVGAIIGSLIAGALLSFVGSYLYKWNKNRNKDGSNFNDNQANTNSQAKRNYYPGQEAVQPPAPASVIDRSYYHGREILNDEIQELKQEIHDLRQIILQSNKQSTSSMGNN